MGKPPKGPLQMELHHYYITSRLVYIRIERKQ